MSIELLLYCKKAPTVSEIEQVIIPLGFKLEKKFSDKEHLVYYWFEEKDLTSLRGCWLSWHTKEIEEAPKGILTVFDAKTFAGRSSEDLDMQNNVIKALEKKFGGSVWNDDTGKWSYLRNDVPKLSYPEKRCGLVYLTMKENIGRIKIVASDVSTKVEPSLKELGLSSFDKNIIVNNLLVPFMVSSLEDFLKSFLISYIESQSEVKELVYGQNRKLEYAKVRELVDGKTTIAECEANNYNFQNLGSANSAFKQFVEVDLYRIWSRRKKYNGKVYRTLEVLQELLALRHRIIHEAYVETNMGKSDVARYTKFVEYAAELLVRYLDKNKGFRVDLEKYV